MGHNRSGKRRKPRNRVPREFSCERVAWNDCRGQSRRCATKRRSYDKKLDRLFPKQYGAEMIMRFSLLHLGMYIARGEVIHPKSHFRHLMELHPDAFRFLSRHGTFYEPDPWEEPPKKEPRVSGCFFNSAKIAHNRDYYLKRRPGKKDSAQYLYVEGVAEGVCADPMHHAWNLEEGEEKVFDWTFYAISKWVRYLGVPLSVEEYTELRLTKSGQRVHPNEKIYAAMSFFRKGVFDIKIRLKLLEILARRKRAGKKVPKSRR